MGAGLPMAPGDIAFKSNFATLNAATGVVERRRADRKFEHLGPALCAALDGLALPSYPQHAVAVGYATEHRCGVVVRGEGLTDAISGERGCGCGCAGVWVCGCVGVWGLGGFREKRGGKGKCSR